VIDPRYVTNYTRTTAELEEFWLFCLVVAGKTATVQARLLDGFIAMCKDGGDFTPFEAIRNQINAGNLLEYLKYSRLGQYTRLERAITQSLDIDLKNASVDEFEAISGVGSKTARFFLLHTREHQEIAVLDTHVLRYMRDQGLTTQKGTPPKGPKYSELEKVFIGLAKAANMSIADFDLHIWRTYSGNT
jgi:thermostable 8-oxoguanine DNA glycosylase